MSKNSALDCYIGPAHAATMVYIVHQMAPPDFKNHDEPKAMLGFPDAEAAKQAYLAHYTDPRFFGSMTEMPFEEFKRKVLATKTKGAVMIKSRVVGRRPGSGQTGFDFAREQSPRKPEDELRLIVRHQGGPYIGPKGGKWADPQHTQHWEPPTGAISVRGAEHKDEPEMTTVARRRGRVFEALGTKPSEWESAEIVGYSGDDEGNSGKDKPAVPVFDVPKGYRIPETMFTGGGGFGGDKVPCQICGTMIKRVFPILHHGRKLQLGVGSECVEKFTDAEMPQLRAAIKLFKIRVRQSEVPHINALIAAGKTAESAVARSRARTSAEASFLKANPLPSEELQKWWDDTRRWRYNSARIFRAERKWLSDEDYRILNYPMTGAPGGDKPWFKFKMNPQATLAENYESAKKSYILNGERKAAEKTDPEILRLVEMSERASRLSDEERIELENLMPLSYRDRKGMTIRAKFEVAIAGAKDRAQDRWDDEHGLRRSSATAKEARRSIQYILDDARLNGRPIPEQGWRGVPAIEAALPALGEQEQAEIRAAVEASRASKLGKSGRAERLHGGKGDHRPDSDFDPEQLAEGTKHEREHSDDPAVAKEIAKDHLTEDKDYYRKLKKIEKSERPPAGSGWSPVPRTKHGGFRRRKGAEWEYWYPAGTHEGESGWEQHLAEMQEKRDLVRQAIKLWGEYDLGRGQYAMVMPDPSEKGKVRVQWFDEDGFSGHHTAADLDEIAKEFHSPPTPAKGILDKLSATERWAEGTAAARMIQFANRMRYERKYPLASAIESHWRSLGWKAGQDWLDAHAKALSEGKIPSDLEQTYKKMVEHFSKSEPAPGLFLSPRETDGDAIMKSYLDAKANRAWLDGFEEAGTRALESAYRGRPEDLLTPGDFDPDLDEMSAATFRRHVQPKPAVLARESLVDQLIERAKAKERWAEEIQREMEDHGI